MSHFAEPLVQDTLWYWLDSRPEYEQVGGEVYIGDGQIDLVAKTTNGDYHGFEVKNTAGGNSLLEQLERYRDSGYLDKLYYCARKVDNFFRSLERKDRTVSTDFKELGTTSDALATAIALGKIEKSELRGAFERQVPDDAQRSKVEGRDLTLAEVFFNDIDIPPPLTEERKKEAPTDINSAIEQIKDAYVYRQRLDDLGVIVVPLDLFAPSIPPHYRNALNIPPSRAFDPEQGQSPHILREADTIDRSEIPPLSKTNETWVQYHVQRDRGSFREGVLPDTSTESERQIDVIAFQGAYNATEIYHNQERDEYELIGIEAKGDSLTPGSGYNVRDQLDSYLLSGGLTRLYLAVPEERTEVGETILEDGGSGFGDVGLLSVDTSGGVTEVRSAGQLEMRYDGYLKNERVRAMGYGTAKVQSEHRFNSLVPLSQGGA